MSDAPHDAGRLQADLAQLRAALRKVEAPAPDEAALLERFRKTQRARDSARKHVGGARRLPLAAAAAIAVAVGGAVWTAVALRGERAGPAAPVAGESAEAAPSAVGAFQPLLNAPGLSPSSSYSVVRVRIPLSAFAVVPGTLQDASIEADLLVGEDGLARAIRFNEADALRVSVADQ
jgi:hypothetical protein